MLGKILLISSLCLFVKADYSIADIKSDASIATQPAPSKTIEAIKKEPVSVPAEPIEFIAPWARASISPNNNSAIYLTIKNNSYDDYTLIGAASMDAANNVELHQSFVDEKGVSRMVALDKIIIPARSEIYLQPGGMHIMLFDLKRTLKVGDKFRATLKFLTIGNKNIDVEVKDY